MSEQKRSVLNTFKLMMTQRKGQIALISFIIATVNTAAATKSYFAGKMSTELYYQTLELFFAALGAVFIFYMISQGYEDGQAKSGPNTQMALGDNAKVTSVKITTEDGTEAITDPQTPNAIENKK